jgi:hypothetical protein
MGGGQPAAAIQAAPTPVAAPPVTTSSAEVIQAQQDIAQQNLMKKSIKKTVFAGDTGGYKGMPATPAGGPSPTSAKLG